MKVCPQNINCKFQHEHQHCSEYSHDNNEKNNNKKNDGNYFTSFGVGGKKLGSLGNTTTNNNNNSRLLNMFQSSIISSSIISSSIISNIKQPKIIIKKKKKKHEIINIQESDTDNDNTTDISDINITGIDTNPIQKETKNEKHNINCSNSSLINN